MTVHVIMLRCYRKLFCNLYFFILEVPSEDLFDNKDAEAAKVDHDVDDVTPLLLVLNSLYCECHLREG